jgi:dTDP-4-dehydrorhamnose 3,5-epimerase-like enzyme
MNNLIKKFNKHGNLTTGFLSYFESDEDIGFEIKRIYYIYNVPKGTKRGLHSHKKLRQILWCPHGIIEIILDDGNERETYILDSPEKSIFVGERIWREMIWRSEGAVLCVAASEYYDEDDYIRCYETFLKDVKGRK